MWTNKMLADFEKEKEEVAGEMMCSNKDQIKGLVFISHKEFFKGVYTFILKSKEKLKEYAIKNGADEQYYIAIRFLDNAMEKAHKNKAYCEKFYHFTLNTSTIDLRMLLSVVGCAYWNNLEHANACDLIDTLIIKTKK